MLNALGLESAGMRETDLEEGWLCYSLNHDRPTRDVPVLLIEHGPKNVSEIKKQLRNADTYIALFVEQGTLILRILDQEWSAQMRDRLRMRGDCGRSVLAERRRLPFLHGHAAEDSRRHRSASERHERF